MRIVFTGAGGHGKVCAEIAELMGYHEILFLDDNKELNVCGEYSVVGSVNDFKKFSDLTTDFFVSIGNTYMRRQIQEKIKDAGGRIATLVHPHAVVSKDVVIGNGTVVMAGSVISTGTETGEGIIVNTASSIGHDCRIGDYCHIAVGAHLCGTVFAGNNCWIGAGATVSNNVSICNNCTIGAGALVIHDITVPDTYIGVPAKQISERLQAIE